MNKPLKGLRRMAHSAVVTMLLVGIATPACTTSHVVSPVAKPTAFMTDVAIHRDSNIIQSHEASVAYANVTEKTAEDGCTTAVYWADEPLSSQMEPTSAADLEQMCANEKNA